MMRIAASKVLMFFSSGILAVVLMSCTSQLGSGHALSPSWYTPPPGWEAPGGPARSRPSYATTKTTAETSLYSTSGSGSVPFYTGDKMKEEPPRVEEFHGEEEHKPLFPLDWTDYLGFFCASLGLMLAAGGGIGGGGMLVPLYILVMGFSPKHAIPLSNVTVFGGACANLYLNQPKRHPKADRPLMDWDLILIMQPMTIAGALLGSFVNKILPTIILTICLVALLAYTTHGTLQKGFAAFKKESDANAAKASAKLVAPDEVAAEKDALLSAEDGEDEAEAADGGAAGGVEAGEEQQAINTAKRELEGILEEERGVPSWKWQTIWAVFAVVIAVNLVKVGSSSYVFWFSGPLLIGRS